MQLLPLTLIDQFCKYKEEKKIINIDDKIVVAIILLMLMKTEIIEWFKLKEKQREMKKIEF